MDRTPESIARLIDDLQGGDEFERAQAAFALGMLGEPAVAPLVQLLRHTDRDVRMRAAWSLGVIGHPALGPLLDLADGPDPTLRVEAIRVLGVIGEGRAINQLFHGLADPDPHVAHRAAAALGKIGDPRAFHPLLTALYHPSPDVRYAVCGALGHLHITGAIVALDELAATDQGRTSWDASVAQAARRAVQEIAAARPKQGDDEFERVSALLQRQPTDEQ
ncbi:MAG: HEAT repeat domain-containing protein [Kouleothrix sp.]|jgi:HEAT repeat protein|nr:HEAT repeat domain-containing protein [Kouleothrix sp.]